MQKTNKLYYSYAEDSQIRESMEDATSLFLEEGSPGSSCWFSKLPLLVDGFKTVHSMLRSRHYDYKSGKAEMKGPMYTAKVCPGIIEILKTSILVKAPCDIAITIDSDGLFTWFNGAHGLLNIVQHLPKQMYQEDHNIFKGKLALKFELPLMTSTKGKFSYIVLAPQYHGAVPYTVPNGVMSKDYPQGMPLNIIGLFDIPDRESVTHVINKGTVLAYYWSESKIKLHKTKVPLPHTPRLKFLRGI